MVAKKALDLAFPELRIQFDSKLNLGIKFEDLYITFESKIFWNCPAGHLIWQTPRNRTQGKCKPCHIDASRVYLEDSYSEILSTFDSEMNDGVEARKLFSRSPGEYWWKCSESSFAHSYKSSVKARIANRRCPYCSGTKILPGFNDWKTLYEVELMDLLWDYKKNVDSNGYPIEPENLGVDDREMRYWKCLKGDHERVISISSAIQGWRLGKTCRTCAGFRAVSGVSDIPAMFPELLTRLNPSLHHDGDLNGVHPGSELEFNWVCENNHEWRRSIREEIRAKGCSKCIGKQVWEGHTDIASQHPRLASEFASDLNLDTDGIPLLPSNVHQGSNTAFWWRCVEHQHIWRTSVQKRTLDKTNCPFCSDRRVWPGYNDLWTKRPDLVSEINFDRHPHLEPRKLLWVSHQVINWICTQTHEWSAQLVNRTSNGSRSPTGCPDCAAYGFKPNEPAVLYLIKNEKLGAYKVGIANLSSVRLQSWLGKSWHVISTFDFEKGYTARISEKAFHFWRRSNLGVPNFLEEKDVGRLGGFTETFEISRVERRQVVEKLEELVGLARANDS
jgi:hypothetical protein